MNICDHIIFESPDYLVIDKPAGLIVHTDGRTEESNLVDLLIAEFPEIKGVGDSAIEGNEFIIENEDAPERSGIVHRLDRDTSGVMVVARTQAAYEDLKRQFHDRLVSKEYHAFVYGAPKRERGSITAPIGREKGTERFNVPPRVRGETREALTYYQCINSFVYDGQQFSFVRAMPKTGRTHQIRVHLKSIGCPIVADSGYVGKGLLEHTLGFKRQALHARILKFTNLAGKEVEYTAEYPDDFVAAQLLGSK